MWNDPIESCVWILVAKIGKVVEALSGEGMLEEVGHGGWILRLLEPGLTSCSPSVSWGQMQCDQPISCFCCLPSLPAAKSSLLWWAEPSGTFSLKLILSEYFITARRKQVTFHSSSTPGFTHHDHQNVPRRPGEQVQSPHCHQHSTAWVQLEEAGTSRVLAAVDGVDEAFAIVLIRGLDLEEFHPRQCVLGDCDFIVIPQKLRPMAVDVGNHEDVDLGRGTRHKETDWTAWTQGWCLLGLHCPAHLCWQCLASSCHSA